MWLCFSTPWVLFCFHFTLLQLKLFGIVYLPFPTNSIFFSKTECNYSYIWSDFLSEPPTNLEMLALLSHGVLCMSKIFSNCIMSFCFFIRLLLYKYFLWEQRSLMCSSIYPQHFSDWVFSKIVVAWIWIKC